MPPVNTHPSDIPDYLKYRWVERESLTPVSYQMCLTKLSEMCPVVFNGVLTVPDAPKTFHSICDKPQTFFVDPHTAPLLGVYYFLTNAIPTHLIFFVSHIWIFYFTRQYINSGVETPYKEL